MGHDILEYRGHHAVFSDVILWMLRCFLLAEARRRESMRVDSEVTALREFFEGWQWPGPGVVMGTDFDKYTNTSESRRQLLLNHLQQRDGWSEESPDRAFIWFKHFISGSMTQTPRETAKDTGVVYGVGIDQIFLLESVEESTTGKWYRLKYDTPDGIQEATVNPFPNSGSPPAYEATLEADRTVFGTAATTKFEVDQVARLHRVASEPKSIKLSKPISGVVHLKGGQRLVFASIYMQKTETRGGGFYFPFTQSIRFEGKANLEVAFSKLAEVIIREVKGESYSVDVIGTARSTDGESLHFNKLPGCGGKAAASFFGTLKDGRAFEVYVHVIERITFGNA